MSAKTNWFHSQVARRSFLKAAASTVSVVATTLMGLGRHQAADAGEAVEERNLQVELEALRAWNTHDPVRHAAMLAESYVEESDTLPAPLRGREAQMQVMRMYFKAFPDLYIETEQLLASGDFVVTRWHATGTHRGDFMGIPPTNRSASVHGATVVQYGKGKIARQWTYLPP